MKRKIFGLKMLNWKMAFGNKNSQHFRCPIYRNIARCGNGNDFSEILSCRYNTTAGLKALFACTHIYTTYIHTFYGCCWLDCCCLYYMCTEQCPFFLSLFYWGLYGIYFAFYMTWCVCCATNLEINMGCVEMKS